METHWKTIPDFPNYEIGNHGIVRSIPHITIATHTNKKGVIVTKQQNRCGVELKNKIERHGYVTCSLMKDGKANTKTVHRLVGEAFIPNPENKEHIDHIDRNKQNNIVSNLRWVTRSENQWNRGRTDDQYIQCVWKVAWTKDGKMTQRQFKTEEEARAFRLTELGF